MLKFILNFFEFCLANKNIQDSAIYIKCQQNPLETEINQKKLPQKTMSNEFNCFSNDSLFSLSCVKFTHIPAIFLNSNNVSKTHDSIHERKLNQLLIESQLKQDVFFHFSNVSLKEAEKPLLLEGLGFSLPWKKPTQIKLILSFFIEGLIYMIYMIYDL